MNQIKKILAMMLALVMVMSMLPTAVFAAENATFTVSSVTATPGDEVTLTVDVANNPGLFASTWSVEYDTDVLEKVSYTASSIDGVTISNLNDNFLWENVAMEDLQYNGKILELKFKIKDNAAVGETEVQIVELLVSDCDGNQVFFDTVPGKITITPEVVTSITLDKTELTVNQGETATLVATVLPENATDKTVTWSSNNESVATVADGIVTAVGAGSAKITAEAGDKTATCDITVVGANVPATGITVTSPAHSGYNFLMVGTENRLVATVTPDYTTDKTVWTSSNEAVATVDENGVVTPISAGSVTITATAGEVSANKSFTVFDELITAKIDGEDVDVKFDPKDSYASLKYVRINVPAGTKTVELYGTETMRFSNKNAVNAENCPAGMSFADNVLTVDLAAYTKNDTWFAAHYAGVTYDKYSQRTIEFYEGSSGWKMYSVLIIIEPCEGDHTWIEATCTDPKRCSSCGTSEGEALGHDWEVTTPEVPAVCETPGTTAVEACKRDGCEATQGGKTIAAPGHAWRKVMTTKEPTCDEDGEELYTCTTCPEGDAASKTEPIAALDHDWDEGEVTTLPTCTEKGVKTFGCKVDGCDGSKTEDVPANGHNYVNGYCSVETCRKMEPTVIPMTNANHTNTGSVLGGSMFAGIDALEVSDIKVSDWSEWSVSGLNRTITIYVDPVYKNETVTLRMLAKTGYNGTSLFNTPANVQLVDGVYNYRANAVKIDANGIPTQLQFNLIVNFALGKCTGEHTWLDATCEAPKTCDLCGETEGEALGHDWNEESVCRREGCGASNKITEIELTHPNLKSEAMTMVTGTNEKITVSFNAVDNKVGATQVVAWFSSDETIATVADGVVTALKAGTVTITAKAVDANGIALMADGEEVLAQFTLTVEDPGAGYTVTMGGDIVNALIGSDISVPVTVGHTGEVTKYNAFDFTFEYDPAVLELTSTEITGMTVTVKDGKIHVERYGTALTVGETALTLTFKAVATGESNVKVTSAKVDISEAALTQDAPDASVIDNITLVSVAGYTVSLPTEFKGESSVLPGENYTFEAKDKNYVYTVKATIDGNEIPVTDNGNGTFTIAADKITGNVVITTEKSGKVVNVKLGDDMTGNPTAQYMTAYTATLTKAAGYNYNVTVEIGGQKFTGFTYDDATGLVTIPGEAITGEIVFNSNKTAQAVDMHNIEFAGEYGDIAEDTKLDVANGSDYTLTINKVVGYKYTVTATMNGEAVEVTDNGDGTYTIKNVTGDLKITIAKEYDLAVEVAEYVTLNGKTMFLVTATGSVDEGKVLAYGGTAMFWSNQYNAWSYLVITDSTLSVEDAKTLITLNEGEKVELDQTYNVNETANNTVDINDAQLVFDMYNNKYQDFETVTMQKFLKADVNGDKTINVNDAAAVVSEIVKNK